MNILLLLAATVALRNPFWPIGFEGEREAISPEPTVAVKTVQSADGDETATSITAEALDDAATSVTARHWTAARQTLRISGTTIVTNPDGSVRQGILINGLTYTDGDLISINHGTRRFTWRVQGLTEGKTLRLIRVRARKIDDSLKGTEP